MKSSADPKLHVVEGEPSWKIATPEIEAYVTRSGGQLGPVTFDRAKRKLRPLSVAPWGAEKRCDQPPILRALRGDFFCMPFGGNATPWRGERHPVHGETANGDWKVEATQSSGDLAALHLSLPLKIRPGRADKLIVLRRGHPAVYSRHEVSGARGPMTIGQHAMVHFPDRPASGVLSTGGFTYGQVFPGAFESPENAGYQCLKPGAEFDRLDKVPMADGGIADLTSYPARRGFEDLVMLVGSKGDPFAWNAVTFPREGYVWFALKDPQILRHTILWLSNGGRHYPPWSGRHINVLGVEDLTAYFHFGLAESAKSNPVARRGFPTCVRLDPRRPLEVPYIMGCLPVPRGFDQVAVIEPESEGILLVAKSGKKVKARVDVGFLAPARSA